MITTKCLSRVRITTKPAGDFKDTLHFTIMKRFLREFEQGGLSNPNHSLDNSFRFKKRKTLYHRRRSPSIRSRPSPYSGLSNREDMAGSAWNTPKNAITTDKQSLHEQPNSYEHMVRIDRLDNFASDRLIF